MKELVPHPSALIESMRSIGYRPPTAIADLIDNSIAAAARKIEVHIEPVTEKRRGWVKITDDGSGMSANELYEAMRWGGDGPQTSRKRNDLGRFYLGLKTASFSIGKRLTVVSRKNGLTSALRWDLDAVSKSGKWLPLDGADKEDLLHFQGTILDPKDKRKSGTVVLISSVDKMKVGARSLESEERNRSGLILAISSHLRVVFHRFLEKNTIKIKFGSMELQPWNLLGPSGSCEEQSWVKDSEPLFGGKVKVRTFIIPHHKYLSEDAHKNLGGPGGWNAHQGFFIYRNDRLIMPGGWLGYSRPEEHCKLARVVVDLTNDTDEAWGLDVMKSRVTPPAALAADIERIARKARVEAMKRYSFHGEKEAPKSNGQGSAAFWNQIIDEKNKSVVFRVNRGHPLVEALIQNLEDPTQADAFLRAFERLLPVSAIMQQPARTTNGLGSEPGEQELVELRKAFEMVVDVLRRAGKSEKEATEFAKAIEPFARFADHMCVAGAN
jgi:hypothetical protein